MLRRLQWDISDEVRAVYCAHHSEMGFVSKQLPQSARFSRLLVLPLKKVQYLYIHQYSTTVLSKYLPLFTKRSTPKSMFEIVYMLKKIDNHETLLIRKCPGWMAIYSNCQDFCYIFGVDFRDINVVLMPSVQVIQSTHILSFGMCMLAVVLML